MNNQLDLWCIDSLCGPIGFGQIGKLYLLLGQNSRVLMCAGHGPLLILGLGNMRYVPDSYISGFYSYIGASIL